MNKKEYIEKLANLIISRVRFHAPIVYDGGIDLQLLEVVGMDASLPLFKFEKQIDEVLFKAFMLAQEKVKFNLITTEKPLINNKKLAKLKNFYYFKEAELGYSLLSTINALNINYKSGIYFEKDLEEDYIKINGQIVNLVYKPYMLHKKASDNGVVYEIREFLLNGKNFILNFSNSYEQKKLITFEINVVLPRGYYHFTRLTNAIQIENLTSREKAYFNFQSKNAKFTFSSMSGIESSTHACVNLKMEIMLRGREQKRFFFNYGENQYYLASPHENEEFFKMSQNKMNEIFDLKVTTADKKFDERFNLYMPQKIWLSWLKMEADEENENEYIKTKYSLVKKEDNGYLINESFKGLKQLEFSFNNGAKRVFIVPGKERYLFADKTKYFNFTLLTNEIFKKNNEIYLSFGQ